MAFTSRSLDFSNANTATCNRIAELNIGLICSCLPILPILFRRRARSSHKSSGRSSGYYRLRTFGTSSGASGLPSANRNQEQGSELGLPLNTMANDGDMDSTIVSGSHSTTFQGATDHAHKDGSGWQGDGILKTVDVEQIGCKVPEAALITPHGTRHTGSRSATYGNATR